MNYGTFENSTSFWWNMAHLKIQRHFGGIIDLQSFKKWGCKKFGSIFNFFIIPSKDEF